MSFAKKTYIVTVIVSVLSGFLIVYHFFHLLNPLSWTKVIWSIWAAPILILVSSYFLFNQLEPTPPPPRRPLSSLSDDEAREVYRLAFGREPYDKLFGTNDSDGQFEIFDYAPEGRRWDITLWEGGRMSATITNQQHQPLYQCPPFAATKVVRYLDSIGIEIG